jgi:hypothetical protein
MQVMISEYENYLVLCDENSELFESSLIVVLNVFSWPTETDIALLTVFANLYVSLESFFIFESLVFLLVIGDVETCLTEE